MANRKRPLRLILFLVCLFFVLLFLFVWTVGSMTSVHGVIVDETGKPLEDVQVFVQYSNDPTPSQAKLNLLLVHLTRRIYFWDDPPHEYDNERKTVNGSFRVWRTRPFKSGNIHLLEFIKPGYYTERFDFNPNSQWRGEMRVVMRKESPPPKKASGRRLEHIDCGLNVVLDCNMKQKTRQIIEFFRPDSVKDIACRTVLPFDQEPEAPEYLYLDFMRDENGEIVFREFPGSVDATGETVKYPAAFIVRLHSDAPDDGMLPVGEGESLAEQNLYDGVIRNLNDWSPEARDQRKLSDRIDEDCRKARQRLMESQNLAPEEGYTRREIVIPLEELIRVWELDGAIRISWFSAYRFAYLRVGGHYAKLFFQYNGSNGRAESADYGATRVFGDDFHASFPYELYLNAKAGKRELSEYD